MKRLVVFVIAVLSVSVLSAQDIKTFKLKNGLSVYVWEDHSKPEVFGEVVVRAGSFDDPEEYTGLAHYLEHVMFKGTQKIGSVDWAKEQPLYEKIIAAYDRMASASSSEEKAAIAREINEASIEESHYFVANEYANLIEGMGGSGLNAATSFDVTYYHNHFPANEISRWLPLASERFINPVFRGFQSELETVYEEYNMYNDQPGSEANRFMFSKLFEGSPYAREVIGKGEHLKNPRLSELIKFYDTWYAANNMALILVGDVNINMLVRLANGTFGRIAPKQLPERGTYPDFNIQGRKQYTTRCSQYPNVLVAYKGVKPGDPDEIALELCMKLLCNGSSTGLLDKKVVAGELMEAAASSISFGRQGRIIINAVPFYDDAQRAFDSNKTVETIIDKAVAEICSGNIDPSTLETIKTASCRDYALGMESMEMKAQTLQDVFVNNLDLADVLAYTKKVNAVTVDDLKRVAKQYLNRNCIVIYNEEGKQASAEKIKKPEIKPIEPLKGQSSQYAQWLRSLNSTPLAENYLDWSKVQEKQLNSYSRVYYTENTKNDVFTLILKYGASSKIFPKLQYAAQLMDNAGIMAQYKPDALKEAFGRLGSTYSISADRNYMYVTLRGYEQNLKESCLLLTRLVLMPDLDEKQVSSLRGSSLSNRYFRRQNVNVLSEAMQEYVVYGEESRYRTEITDKEISEMTISSLSANVSEATKYASEIHYSGKMPFDQVYDILSTSLPLNANELPSSSPVVRKMKEYTEDTIYFLPEYSAQQSNIWFYIPMGQYDKSQKVIMDAFSRYIGGGFNGIIMQEIREYNSMAYTATGNVSSSALPGSGKGFIGYVGTQNDKAADAIALYVSILKNLPEHPEVVEGIRSYLMREALVSQPDERSLSSYIANCRKRGYSEDPAKEDVPQIKQLTYQQILDFYKANIQGKPIVIGVVGNPKNLKPEVLAKYGKVIKLKDRQLFNEQDTIF